MAREAAADAAGNRTDRTRAMTLAAGAHLGPYEILTPLGAGGMGEVYRAKDTRLGRNVAIKVLPEHLADDQAALARFEREAKAVAALSHPNILAVHDVGTDQGVFFVVIELLEGETLRERLRGSALPWRKAMEIGAAIADGMAAAHAKGIYHRDLKPENVFVTSDRVVKILDFGLARVDRLTFPEDGVLGPTQTLETKPGAVMGTTAYMSPEQVRGQRADARSDIFSFGCVLLEMVTGERTFARDTPADTMAAILNEEPPEIALTGKGMPPELGRVIRHCLEKKPEERFQSARDLAFDLRSMESDSRGLTALPGSGAPRSQATMLAVLPFEDMSPEPQEWFSDGMTEEMIAQLGRLQPKKLGVIARTSAMRYKGTDKGIDQIGRELGVDYILEGSVRRATDRVRITASLIQVSDQTQLWAAPFQGEPTDVFALQADVAERIARSLAVELLPDEQAALARPPTTDLAAHEAYLKGRYHWNKRTEKGFRRAIDYFRQAINHDPAYALAHAGIAESYVVLPGWSILRPNEAYPEAKKAAAEALQIDDALGEAHATLACIAWDYEWDWSAAEREFEAAIGLNPGYATAHQWYAEYLASMGRHEEAIVEIGRARELDPLSLIINAVGGGLYYYAREHDQAIDHCRRALELDPGFPAARLFLSWAYEGKGMYDEAVAELQQASAHGGARGVILGCLGYAYAVAGHNEQAEAVLDELQEFAKREYVGADWIALIYIGLGAKDQAFAWLDQACGGRASGLLFLNVDARYDSLRDDSRFDDLLRRIGLEPAPGSTSQDP